MRSSVAALGLFAAAAVAVPYKRDVVVTEVDVVQTVVEIVTVTAGEPVPATATSSADVITTTVASVPTDAKFASSTHWPQFFSGHSGNVDVAAAPSTSVAVVASTSTSAIVSSSTSVYVAPTISSSTSVYVAPTTSSVDVAPTSVSAVEAAVSAAPSAWTSAWTSVYTPVETPAAVTSAVEPAATSAVAQAVHGASNAIPMPAAALSSYSEIAVYHHNIHRANHSAGPVEWDIGLASTAAVIASSCVYAHNTDVNGGGYGQNIAAGVSSDNISSVITDLFYNGEVNYFNNQYGKTQPDMSQFENWGHFSQIVWNATTHVGCATQYCPNGLGNTGSGVAPYFTVCNYIGAGNYANEYGANIFAPIKMATAQWNTGL